MIRAVVLDIGGVLEWNDPTVFPGPFEERHHLREGAVVAAIQRMEKDPRVGEATVEETRDHWLRELGLDETQADELMADFWRWYVGTLDQDMFDWFAAQRQSRLTGLLSNSNPGAREAEACWGFEGIAEVIIYSHEVGLRKPDPAIYDLATRRLGVRPEEIVFVDDLEVNVGAARVAGWHAVQHVSTPDTIRAVEKVISLEQGG